MKRVNKVLFNIIILVSCILIIGCSKDVTKEKVDLFISKDAEDIVYEYFQHLKNGNIDEAKKLCTNNILNKNKVITNGNEKIVAVMKDETKEGRNSAYVLLNIVRGVPGNDISNLDNVTVTVIKDNGKYKIDDIKSKTSREIFVKNNTIRIIGEDGGKSSLVLRLNDLPKEVYSKSNALLAYKEKTPLGEFQTLDIGYQGNKIAVATKDGDRTFLAVTKVGDLNEKNKGGTNLQNDSGGYIAEDILDRPVAQEVIPLDILKNVHIEKFTFTKDDKEVIVSYIDNGARRINIYDSETGDLVELNFDDIFPKNKYNVEIDVVKEEEITIKVSNFKDANKELLGYYKINTEQIGIEKI